jgi:tetratricopeptide (TPR) repeat protein
MKPLTREERGVGQARRTCRGGIAALCLLAAGARVASGDTLDTGGGGMAGRYIVHALAAMGHGRVSEAIEYCNRALARHPDFMGARFARGEVLLAAGQYDAAIADFSAVLAAHPEYPAVYIQRGAAYLRQHETQRAIEDLNRAITPTIGLAPTMEANALAFRSLALEQQGNSVAAHADFQRLLEIVRSDDNGWEVLGGACYTAAVIGLLKTATLACNDAIALHPRDVGLYDGSGLVDLKSGLWSKAIADYTRSLYYQADYTLSLYGRGIARQAVGDAAGGEADIAAARQSEPRIAEIMARLGVNQGGPIKASR